MKTLKELSVEHSYYCHTTNFDSGGGLVYDSWAGFLDEFRDCDFDLNLVFRFDVEEKELYEGDYVLKIFMIHQRKGRFLPIVIRSVTEGDEDEIWEFLSTAYNHLKKTWEPFE